MVAKKSTPRKRRAWSSLSEAYRTRLGRAGISQRDYENGVSVTAARGHAKTPERPSRAAKNPARYPEYVQKHRMTPTLSKTKRLDKLVTRIRLASPRAAKTTVRKAILELTPEERIELAVKLGVKASFPLFDDFSYHARSRISDGWLLAFMTHAGVNASNEPWLHYVRRSPGTQREWVAQYWKGPGVLNIAYAEYRRLGAKGRLTDHEVYGNFKSTYANFFGSTVAGKATPA